MLKMRLQRYGRKNQPEYRVVVTDSRNGPRTGNHVDVIGSYQPKAGTFQVDAEKVKHWIANGVQVSDTVYNFLISKKIIEGKKKNVLPKKSPVIDEAKLKAEAEAKAAAEAKAKADAEAAKAAAEAPAPEVVAEEPVAA
jgi:small subunit ribosomal protein S16